MRLAKYYEFFISSTYCSEAECKLKAVELYLRNELKIVDQDKLAEFIQQLGELI